jgi:hypothetical protein
METRSSAATEQIQGQLMLEELKAKFNCPWRDPHVMTKADMDAVIEAFNKNPEMFKKIQPWT